MKQLITITKTKSKTPKRKKSVNGKFLYKNGESKISIDKLSFPSYEEIKKDIDKKLGSRPELTKEFDEGIWTEQALRVLSERYLLKNDQGEVIETPAQMCWRVSWEVASAEARWGKSKKEVLEEAQTFYNLLSSREFLPNSPTLMNAGTGNGLQYSGCYVLPVEDSIEGIFDALKYQAQIHKTGGGTGFAFSRLRPNGSRVRTSTGTASGPVSFMKIFDAATNQVKQGGKRRGANMGILRVDHPDILEFIHCKEDGGITNFNISVAITDRFIEAFEKDEEYELADPRDGRVVGKLGARMVFDEIAQGAWKTGDPGLVFIDRINKGLANPVPSLGPVESTNPCGEQPLYPFDSCNLGSIFLTYFVKREGSRPDVDWEKLRRVTRIAIRFMDGVIEMNPYPLEQVRKTTLAIRRIGLGIGGWADLLIELGIPYDSEEALSLAEKVMKTVQEEAVAETRALAKQRGPFPLWPFSIYKDEVPRRNSTVTTIAPTGTISIIAGASSGIEPLFAIAFQHIVKDKHLDRKLTFVNPKFEEVAKKRGFWTEAIKEKVLERGVIRDIQEIPQEIRDIFGTAHEIDPDWHVKTQAVFQKYTENAVSKTINLRHEASVDDIKRAYLQAWEIDCKGITVFRDGCKDAQVLNLGVKEKQGDLLRIRPFKVSGATYKLLTPLGSAFITINGDEKGDPLEVFVNIGKAGSDVAAIAEALGRTISTALRFHGSLSARQKAKEISHQLSGIGGRRSVGFGPNRIRSLPDAVAVALSSHFGFEATSNVAGAVMAANSPTPAGEGQLPNGSSDDPTMASAPSEAASNGISGDLCPSCGARAFVYEEGCSKCYSCGHSEC